ncbi:hypothetical protein W893_05745, partial [Staphylococcus aureus subsp. aureus ST 1413]
VKENIDKNTTFVMTIDDEIISTITVRYPWGSVKSISGYPFVWWFATNPEYEGKGYGSQLLTYVEEAVFARYVEVSGSYFRYICKITSVVT